MIQAVDYSKYFGSSIRGFRYLMLNILYQIHIFNAPYLTSDTYLCQFQTRLFPAKPSCIQSCIRTKLLRRTPVMPGCYWLARLWLLSSSQYPGDLMKKLMSHHKERRPIASNQLFNFTTNRDV